MVTVTTPQVGRGAWPFTGAGGTLTLDGRTPPPGYDKPTFYRTPSDSLVPFIGLTGYKAVKANGTVSVNDYATYRAVCALQKRCGAVVDGLFGNDTRTAVVAFQQRAGLIADGIVGPTTARRMWQPILDKEAPSPRVAWLASGHLSWESGFDSGAVGGTSPDDVGISQINVVHKLTFDQRLDPWIALDWVGKFVADNLAALAPNEDDGIAAYNLGIAGAKSWRSAGRPQYFKGRDVWAYIAAIRTRAGEPPTVGITDRYSTNYEGEAK